MIRTDFSKVLNVLAGLWPRHQLTEERQGQYWKWFRNFTVDEVCEQLRAHFQEAADVAYPKLLHVRAKLWAACGDRNQSRWRWTHEQELHDLRNWYLDRRLTPPHDSSMCVHLFGFTPNEVERGEAIKAWHAVVDAEHERYAAQRGQTQDDWLARRAVIGGQYGGPDQRLTKPEA